MLDFDIQRCTRHCAASDRELRPGEVFYSVLIAEGGEVRRRDYSEEAWQEPPAGAIGWWKSRMPEANAHKLHWAPNDVMLHYFEQLGNDPTKQDVRYILALLMIRRRVVRMDDTESKEHGQELLVLHCPKNEQEYKVPIAVPTGQRVAQIQEELAQLLFAEAVP